MTSFKNFWKDLTGNIKEERQGAKEYQEMAVEETDPMKRNQLRNMAADEERHAEALEDMDKSIFNRFTKPGPSIHSSKWDECVTKVSESNPSANAYAVCTAQLGEESFKSEHQHLAYVKSEVKKAQREVAKEQQKCPDCKGNGFFEVDGKVVRCKTCDGNGYLAKMGIEGAGALPKSLLAEQDLEGKTKKVMKLCPECGKMVARLDPKTGYCSDCSPTIKSILNKGKDLGGNHVSGNWANLCSACKGTGYKDESETAECPKCHGTGKMSKSSILSTTAKKLNDIKDKAEDVEDDDENEQELLADKIESLQHKRQKAMINERMGKSFKEMWKGIVNKGHGRECDNCGHYLDEKDFTERGGWSYKCPSCGFKYVHGSKDADE